MLLLLLLLLLTLYILFIFYQYKQYCKQEQAIDQGLWSELVCATYNSIPHINSYLVQVEDDLYYHAVEAVDEGLHTELVYNNV